MVRPISGNQPLRSGDVYADQEGATVSGARGPRGAGPAQGTVSTPRTGAAPVRDEIVRSPATTQTPGQAAVAARQNEIRTTANALLREANATPSGPRINVPAERDAGGFQALVNRQHDRAFRDGAINTGTALLGGAAGTAGHVIHGGWGVAAEVGGVVASELPHAAHLAMHPTVGGAIELGAGVGTHVGLGATVGHPSNAGFSGAVSGAGAAGISTTVSTMARQFEDGDERTRFQQQASVYDANRTALAQQARLATDHGVLDGHLAAVGRRPINWEMFRSNGDYAEGVRRGLAESARDPGSVAHLSLQQPQPARTSIP